MNKFNKLKYRLISILSELTATSIVSRLAMRKSNPTNRRIVSVGNIGANIDTSEPTTEEVEFIFDPRFNCVFDNNGRRIESSILSRGSAWHSHLNPDRLDKVEPSITIDNGVYGGVLFGQHYGHFLIESMSRLWVLDPDYHMELSPVIFRRAKGRHNVSKFVEEIFDVIGIKDLSDMPETQVHVKNGLIPSAAAKAGFISSTYLNFMRKIGDKLVEKLPLESKDNYRKKVYLSRSKLPSIVRKIGRERELERILLKQGFDIIFPEFLSLPQQIQIFNNAELIAGPIGSAFHTLPLTRNPNLKILYLVEADPKQSYYTDIDQAMGLESEMLCCLYSHPWCFKGEGVGKNRLMDVDFALDTIVDRSKELCKC